MAYNAVGTPRIYVNDITFGKALGLIQFDDNDDGNLPLEGNPASITTISLNASVGKTWGYDRYNVQEPGNPNYVAYLGHNLASMKMGVRHAYYSDEAGGYGTDWNGGHSLTDIVNGNNGSMQIDIYDDPTTPEVEGEHSGFLQPQHDGFSICGISSSSDGSYWRSKFNFQQDLYHESTKTLKIGAIWTGRYFDFPHSPDLKLSLTYETGTKTIETKGGASLSNTMWRPPMWGDKCAWGLGETANQKLAHSSRRTWDLNFSYLDKTNTFPKYNALNRYSNEALSEDAGTDDDNVLLTNEETLLDSSDFFSQVWNKVGNGYSFIFQPDNSANEFAIAKFDQKNISFSQQSPSLYSCKMKIKEVW